MLYGAPGREPEEVVITRVSLVVVEVSWPGLRRYKSVWPEELMPLPEGEARAEVDLAAASQASLNEFAAMGDQGLLPVGPRAG